MSGPLPPPDVCHGALSCLSAEMHAPDWIQAGLLLIAIVALIYTARMLKEQARGRDFENYLTFSERITAAWRRFGGATEKDRYFEFTELVNLFEAACHLYTKRIIAGATREMIRDYLCDMLPVLFSDEEAMKMIARAKTTNLTYEHILAFAKQHGLDRVTVGLTKI
jgi:hypothetical protein